MEIATTRCCLDKQVSWISSHLRALDAENAHRLPYILTGWKLRTIHQRLTLDSAGKQNKSCIVWKTHSVPVGLEESSSLQSGDPLNEDENVSEDSPEKPFAKPLSSDELKSLLADSERAKLTKKLSESNQQNRFLKRQLQIKEDSLVNFKSELAVMELEIQALVSLAEEISQAGIPEGSRKINGRYIQSHLHSRLEAVHEKLKEQIKDVDAAQSKEIPLFWCGMAESVQVMGSFDGWSQGEHLSPEYTGSFTKFSTTLLLRPGRYEIKFVVDGEWLLSPEYPTVGEGLMENNLLIVE
ncbi:protein PTST, chloroplastic [Herrania umbratica]|uniref:Protein PTST, chloroplastic n=1 Tax=Herrania umbratica TaxID=108875 RepID=A0A6J1BBB4_9ROSI|nr:protein PTST, chloroplastic [Herrania umbratica]XP_021296428.1 protein PTST, chloroplastic [Herrania umbratica]